MLSFDIETTGLNKHRDRITCACAYDPDRNISAKFTFPVDAPASEPEDFMRLLDEAPVLCAFNGVYFDVPFICAHWKVDPSRAAQWMRKLVDVFHMCKQAIGQTFSLNVLLSANDLGSKNGNGADAITLAREGKWEELATYCLYDCIKTREVTVLPVICLPPPRIEGGTRWVLRGLRFDVCTPPSDVTTHDTPNVTTEGTQQ